MVIMALPTGILAAPQQRPSSQVFSPLLALPVPLERAFSHLEPAFPAAGLALETRALMVASAAVLAV